MSAQLQLVNVSKSYDMNGRTFNVLKDVNLEVNRGSVTSILGPSQCGKSTLCKVMGGMEKPSFGRIFYEGRELTRSSPSIAITFHDGSLFPWFTIRKNVELGLTIRREPKTQIKKKVDLYLKFFELEPYENCYPKDLPEILQYRVGLARSLAVEPNVLLLDDPFKAMDERSAEEMRKILEQLHSKKNTTLVITTSNVSEGLKMADEVVVLSSLPSTVKVRAALPPKVDRDEFGLVTLRDKILDMMDESIKKAEEALVNPLIYDDLKRCFSDLWKDTENTMLTVRGDYLKGLDILKRIEQAEARSNGKASTPEA